MASSGVSRRAIAQASNFLARTARNSIAPRAGFPLAQALSRASAPHGQHAFSTCQRLNRGIMPDTSAPETKETPAAKPTFVAVELSESEYHEVADNYLDSALAKFEQLQETREDIDVEFSSGVMTIIVRDKGTYVINKQPPNKQVWLSSPSSGPKRYDWCISSEGQGDKEGTAAGHWVYARDNTTLDEIILQEIGVDIEGPVDS